MEPPTSRARTIRSSILGNRALFVVGAVISGVCLWLAFRRVSLGDVRASLADAEWIWILPSIAVIYLTLVLRAVRWRHLFLDPERVSNWESAKAINIGFLFNNILPSRAGELPRIFALGRRTGISKVEIGGTIFVERCLDVLTIAVAALIAWPWLPDDSWIQALCVLCAIFVAGFVASAVAVAVFRQRARFLAEAILRRLPLISDASAVTFTASIARGVHIVANPRRLVLAMTLSAVIWTLAAVSVLTLFPAFDLPVSMTTAWLVIVASSLALTVPSTSGGLGVYEAAAQAALVASGTSASVALSYALVLHAVNFIPISLTGALAAWVTFGRKRGAEVEDVPAPVRAP